VKKTTEQKRNEANKRREAFQFDRICQSYRNYRIKEVGGIDDYVFSFPLPDLFVIDGGKGHLALWYDDDGLSRVQRLDRQLGKGVGAKKQRKRLERDK